jgi:hypothetical protein
MCLVTIENYHVNLKGTIKILDKICFIFIFKLNCYKKSWRWQQPVEYEYCMESNSFINIETEIKSLGQGLTGYPFRLNTIEMQYMHQRCLVLFKCEKAKLQ